MVKVRPSWSACRYMRLSARTCDRVPPHLRDKPQSDAHLPRCAFEFPIVNSGYCQVAKYLRRCGNQPDSTHLAVIRHLNIDHDLAAEPLVQQLLGKKWRNQR